MSRPRTYRRGMRGDDIKDWQQFLHRRFAEMRIDYPLDRDGIFGEQTRSATAALCYAEGLLVERAMADGVTPELRRKLRHRKLTKEDRERRAARRPFRRKLRRRFNHRDVAPPLAVILQDSWGYHPGIHDGVDLICPPKQPALAICKARVVRADAGGWWGLGAPSDPSVRARGDGIIILECLIDDGPFFRGLEFGYGHCEGVKVREGELVEAGEVIGHAGLANAWHLHFMANGRSDGRGVGDRDPMPFVRYAQRHS